MRTHSPRRRLDFPFPSPLPDAEIVRLLPLMNAGDREARVTIFYSLAPVVLTAVHRYGSVRFADTEDTAQQAFLVLWKALPFFRSTRLDGLPRAAPAKYAAVWARRAVVNYVIRCMRRRKWEICESDADKTDPDLIAPDSDPSGWGVEPEVAAALHEVIDTLPPRQAAVFRLRFGFGSGPGCSQHEAGRILGIAQTTVRVAELAGLKTVSAVLAERFPSLAADFGPLAPKDTPVVVKVTPDGALKIVWLRGEGLEIREIAARVGVDSFVVANVLRGNTLNRVTGIKPGTSIRLTGTKSN